MLFAAEERATSRGLPACVMFGASGDGEDMDF